MPTTGPNFPTAATGNTSAIGGGTKIWTNPTNIEANDGAVATCTSVGGQVSDDLIGTGFGFAITSTDTINGILFEVRYACAGGGSTENTVNLLKAGVSSGTNKSTGATPPTGLTTVSYGGSGDLWGTTWTPTDINNANFGAATSYNVGAADNVTVDFFRITITSTSAGGGTNKARMLMMF